MVQVILLSIVLAALFLLSGVSVKAKMTKSMETALFYGLCATYLFIMSIRDDIPDVVHYQEVFALGQAGEVPSGLKEILVYGIYAKTVYHVNVEMGYLIISNFFAKLGFSFWLYQFIVGAIELYVIGRYGRIILERFGLRIDNKFLGLFGIIIFYGLYYQFIAFRQGIAIAMGIMACALAIKKRWIPSALIFVLIPAVHITGIFIVVPVVLLLMPAHYRRKGSFVMWAVMFFIVTNGIENNLRTLTDRLISVVLSVVNPIFEYYRESYSEHGVYTVRVLYLAMLFVFLLPRIKKSKYWNFVDIIFLGALIMTLFGSWDILNRLYDICFVGFCALFGYVVENNEVRMSKGMTQLGKTALILMTVAKVVYNYRVMGY